MMTKILRNLSETLHADDMTLYLISGEESNAPITIVATAHNQRVVDLNIPRGEGIVGWVAQTGKSYICNDVEHEEKFYEMVDFLCDYKTNSLLAVPVVDGDTVIGVVQAINKKDGTNFTEEDERIVRNSTTSLLAHIPVNTD